MRSGRVSSGSLTFGRKAVTSNRHFLKPQIGDHDRPEKIGI